MTKYRTDSHTIYDIKYHFLWITKYRYKILHGNVAIRLRKLLRQGCEAKGLEIVRGSISRDHVHLLLSCPTAMSPSQIAQYLKGRSSHLLQDEFPEIKKNIGASICGREVTFAEQWDKWMKNPSKSMLRIKAAKKRRISQLWMDSYLSRTISRLLV